MNECVDVLVVGSGNAGLCAAISASQMGKKVLIIEKAPFSFRGGNSSLTMNFRFSHTKISQLLELIDIEDRDEDKEKILYNNYVPYSEKNFHEDLLKVSNNLTDYHLSKDLSENSLSIIKWLRSLGHRWEYKPTTHHMPSSVPVRLKGSGSSLQTHNFLVAESLGILIEYDCQLKSILFRDEKVSGVIAWTKGGLREILAHSVILSCGGFQANPELRSKYLGNVWNDVALRGVPYNTGDGILAALKIGATLFGDLGGCHSTPQNSNLEPFMLPGSNNESQSNSRYCFNIGITVNKNGERFIDEGQDFPNFVYAKFGAEIVKQPGKIAFQIFSNDIVRYLPKCYFSGNNLFIFNSIDKLSLKFDVNVTNLTQTISKFNAGLLSERYTEKLDRLSTIGVLPPKTNWARKLDVPPFIVAPVKSGITFTYGGLKIDRLSRVLNRSGRPILNLYACGEIVGGIFYGNYGGGMGLMSGSYFGYVAGRTAAQNI